MSDSDSTLLIRLKCWYYFKMTGFGDVCLSFATTLSKWKKKGSKPTVPVF